MPCGTRRFALGNGGGLLISGQRRVRLGRREAEVRQCGRRVSVRGDDPATVGLDAGADFRFDVYQVLQRAFPACFCRVHRRKRIAQALNNLDERLRGERFPAERQLPVRRVLLRARDEIADALR